MAQSLSTLNETSPKTLSQKLNKINMCDLLIKIQQSIIDGETCVLKMVSDDFKCGCQDGGCKKCIEEHINDKI